MKGQQEGKESIQTVTASLEALRRFLWASVDDAIGFLPDWDMNHQPALEQIVQDKSRVKGLLN